MRFNKAEWILLTGMLALCLLVLTGCPKPPVVLQSSVTTRVQKNVSFVSPEGDGWFLGDEGMARLLEAAERCP